ncbi:MAG TPA: thymidine phosphorylase [Thermoanaerobaculia bacterium]|nr:thymidine phosphorylase [Thermoanaerobaculia bacterium]
MPSRSPYDLLNRKRRGEELSSDEIEWLVQAFTRGEVADYQMSAFLMATAIVGMTPEETAALTSAIVASGESWELGEELGFVADKHSTGGVGDKISLVLAPWVAACEVRIGMLSGRGLGHTGGTLDKLETIPGFRAGLSRAEMVRCIERTGCAIATSTDAIAPADRRIYALRDVTGTVESLPLITASIIAKKLAFGASFLLLDVKTGTGAFMATYETAHVLARSLLAAARGSGIRVEAMITNMDRPLGRAIGNASEVLEAMEVLGGGGPGDVLALARAQAERILLASGRFGPETASQALDDALASGAALEKAREWIAAQGGDPSFIDVPSKLGTPKHRKEILAPRSGFIDTIDTYRAGRIAVELGAGRRRQDDSIDPTAGIEVIATVGSAVREGDPIAVLSWSRDAVDAEELSARYLGSIAITEPPPIPIPLIHDILSEDEHGG